MNMFKPTKAHTIEEYMAALSPERRTIIERLDALIQATVPECKPVFSYNMLGYGVFKYRNYKKEIVDWPVIALASQKNYISLYVCSVIDGKYLAESHAAQLGNVKVGKSCIRFKKWEDLDIATIKKVLRLAASSPGFDSLV